MIEKPIIEWLLAGDVSVQYQVNRDLLKVNKPELQKRIEIEGWGEQFLSLRNQNGHWGRGFYQPKWISTHYTLLDLRNLGISNHQREIQATVGKILHENKAPDGGVHPISTVKISDVCINGMFLNYASYFKSDEGDLKSVVDYIISQQLPDGGFNCQLSRKGAHHSSLHSTLSVIEGICEYTKQGYQYRLNELKKAEEESRQFILEHKLYQSHRTGETIDKKMLMLSYPSRWRYDILRALDYFRGAGVTFDNRMTDALQVLVNKQRSDKTWPLQHKHSGQIHFEMETVGKASRWNTLRALRVLEHFGWIDQLKY
jgi:hypothetical protein